MVDVDRRVALVTEAVGLYQQHLTRYVYTMTHQWQDAENIVQELRKQGHQRAYVDGGVTIQRFLRGGLINTIILSTIPTLLGDGVPLFGALPEDRELRLIDSRSYDNGEWSALSEATSRSC